MASIPRFTTLAIPSRFPFGVPETALKAPGSADALPVGTAAVFVTSTGVNAMTLALPKPGVYPTAAQAGSVAGLGDFNDDGACLTVVCTTAQIHTITTPANGVNGTKHIITFTAAIGNFVDMVAYNGSWWVVGSLNATIT